MSITKTITEYTDTIPDKDTQTPSQFNEAADAFVLWYVDQPASLNTWAGQANALATTVKGYKTDAESAKTAAEAAETGAQSYYNDIVTNKVYQATSSSSVSIGTGSKTFTLNENNRLYSTGTKVRIVDNADPVTNYMEGVVTSYDDGTDELVVNVTNTGGSGTLSDWVINLDHGGDADSVNGYVVTDFCHRSNNLSDLASAATSRENLGFSDIAVMTDFDEDPSTTTDLTWGYKAGVLRIDAVIDAVPADTVALTDDTTNYVEIDKSGTVSANTTSFTPGRFPLREVVTASGSQTSSVDKRSWLNITRTGLTGVVRGLELSNNSTDPDHDIDIAPGAAWLTDGNGNYRLFELSSSMTKQIDASWSEGTNQGGFPSGISLTADEHYHWFLLGKDDGTVDTGPDTSATAANLLADATDYRWYCRILSIFTDSSSNIWAILQNGDVVIYVTPITDIADSSVSRGVSETGVVSVPPNQPGLFQPSITASDCWAVWMDVNHPDAISGAGVGSSILGYYGVGEGANRHASGYVTVPVNSSREIAYVGDAGASATLNTLKVVTRGWIDSRRNI